MENTYQPFEIGIRFRVRSPGSGRSADGHIDLLMDRGAFGSGEHETTASCLEILEGLPQVRGARVLDLGSGTGILAIAALKLGAARAVCVDTSPKAVAAAKANCAVNGLEKKAEHVTGTLADLPPRGFDLVLANIYGDILLDIAPGVVRYCRAGGLMLLSGILWEYNFDVRRAYERAGCEVIRNCMLEEFSTVLLRRGRVKP